MDCSKHGSPSAKTFWRLHWRTALFVLSCGLFLIFLATQNYWYWLLDNNRQLEVRPVQTVISFSGWSICLLLLPVSVAFFKQGLRLSERWLVLLIFATVYSLSDVFGFHYPYADRAYLYDPLKDFGESWSFAVWLLLLPGGCLMSLLCLFNRKQPRLRPLWWRIAAPLSVVGIFLLSWYLQRLLMHT